MRPRVTVWHHETSQRGRGADFAILYAPNNHDRFFFLHTFGFSVFDLNVGVAINETRLFTLTPPY